MGEGRGVIPPMKDAQATTLNIAALTDKLVELVGRVRRWSRSGGWGLVYSELHQSDVFLDAECNRFDGQVGDFVIFRLERDKHGLPVATETRRATREEILERQAALEPLYAARAVQMAQQADVSNEVEGASPSSPTHITHGGAYDRLPSPANSTPAGPGSAQNFGPQMQQGMASSPPTQQQNWQFSGVPQGYSGGWSQSYNGGCMDRGSPYNQSGYSQGGYWPNQDTSFPLLGTQGVSASPSGGGDWQANGVNSVPLGAMGTSNGTPSNAQNTLPFTASSPVTATPPGHSADRMCGGQQFPQYGHSLLVEPPPLLDLPPKAVAQLLSGTWTAPRRPQTVRSVLGSPAIQLGQEWCELLKQACHAALQQANQNQAQAMTGIHHQLQQQQQHHQQQQQAQWEQQWQWNSGDTYGNMGQQSGGSGDQGHHGMMGMLEGGDMGFYGSPAHAG